MILYLLNIKIRTRIYFWVIFQGKTYYLLTEPKSLDATSFLRTSGNEWGSLLECYWYGSSCSTVVDSTVLLPLYYFEKIKVRTVDVFAYVTYVDVYWIWYKFVLFYQRKKGMYPLVGILQLDRYDYLVNWVLSYRLMLVDIYILRHLIQIHFGEEIYVAPNIQLSFL